MGGEVLAVEELGIWTEDLFFRWFGQKKKKYGGRVHAQALLLC